MDDTLPAVEDLALGAFRMVKENLQFELDFTADTLPVLDHYLISLREDGEPPRETAVQVVAPCAGAYFGEVVRRCLPGLRFKLPEEIGDYREWRIVGETVEISFNPVGVALEALYGAAIPDWAAHFELQADQREIVNRSLEASGPIREDDYYRLAVRFEVLEQTLAVLTALQRQQA